MRLEITMVCSMTGYGSANVSSEFGEFSIEMRAVNNRFLDTGIKLPRELSSLEPQLRDWAKKNVLRGKFEVSIRWTNNASLLSKSVINIPLLREYYSDLEKEFGHDFAEAAVPSLLRIPSVLDCDEGNTLRFDEATLESIKSTIDSGIQLAFEQFLMNRKREGAFLVEDLSARITRLSELCDLIAREREQVLEDYVNKLRDRIKEFSAKTDLEYNQSRLEMEIVMFADKCDICEELVRMKAHLEAFTKLITGQDDALIGKSLDFLVQEMLREATTTANKCRSVEASALCVEMKTEIEKIREQVQNIA